MAESVLLRGPSSVANLTAEAGVTTTVDGWWPCLDLTFRTPLPPSITKITAQVRERGSDAGKNPPIAEQVLTADELAAGTAKIVNGVSVGQHLEVRLYPAGAPGLPFQATPWVEVTTSWDALMAALDGLTVGCVKIVCGEGEPTRTDLPIGSLYVEEGSGELWQYEAGAGDITTTAANIAGNVMAGSGRFATFSGVDPLALVTFSKPLAASSGGLLSWDAYSTWPNDGSNGGLTWANDANVLGNTGGADTTLFSFYTIPTYYATSAAAFAALAAELPVTLTGYSEYKVEATNDAGFNSDNRAGLSIKVVIANPGWVLKSDLTSIQDGGVEVEGNPRSINFVGATVTTDDERNVTVDVTGYTDEQVRDVMGAALTAGTGITVTPNDGSDIITIASTITQYTDEMARDALGAALTAGTGITITPNDGADTITVASSVSQYTDEMARDAIGAALVAGSNITITVNDGSDTITIAASGGGGGGGASPITPGGRLTLTSNTPVMNAAATAQSTVYYAPHVHAYVPIYDGSSWAMTAFTQRSLSLNSTDNVSGSLYDVFVFDNSGTLTLGTGPAWSSSTSRGTGAGTTELEMKDGILTNKVSITLKAGGSTVGTPAANRATFLGTIYCSANGQTGFNPTPAAASGGSAPFVYLSNAYNREPITLRCQDSKASWTYNSTAWQSSDASTSNRGTFVDGIQASDIFADFQAYVQGNTTGPGSAVLGLFLDATSGTPTSASEGAASSVVIGHSLSVAAAWTPQLGLHYVQAAEARSGANSVTFLGAAATTPTRQFHNLVVKVMY